MPGMTDASELTVRTWSATASPAGAGAYSRYFADTLLPQLRELPGFAGAYLLRRELGQDGIAELTAHTFWESREAVRAFAGDDITVAIVEPEARAMLLDFARTATHRSVVADARGCPGRRDRHGCAGYAPERSPGSRRAPHPGLRARGSPPSP